MKKFRDRGEYFVLSAFCITAIPFSDNDEVGAALAKAFCEDACYLSAAGNGQTSIELCRIAEKRSGVRIQHILAIRTHDGCEQDCVLRQEALVKGILTQLHRSGYMVGEISYEDYRKHIRKMEAGTTWALKKQDITEYGVQGTYKSPSIIEKVDWKTVYSVLDGSGCSICIQIIPAWLSEDERRMIAENAANCSQAVDGLVPNLRDSLAVDSAGRWKRYAKEAVHPFAEVNLLIAGEVANAALTTARIRQSIQGGAFQTIPFPGCDAISIHNQPWQIAHAVRQSKNPCFSKWTSDEVSRIFCLPSQAGYFVGIEGNPLSMMPENDVLPEPLTRLSRNSLHLGKSIASGQNIFMPLEQLLLHTAVLGKSGVGKTTFLKQIIARLHEKGVPVLILEPVKREYRDLVADMRSSTVFTVERPVTPLLINPFYPPAGVTLGEYKSSLLSAFKAAFSLPDPLPALLEKAVSEAYTLYGWMDMSTNSDRSVSAFDMADFVRVFKRVIAESSYSGEVKGNMMSGGAFRLQSLIERCPHTFNTIRSTSVEDLINGCAVLEMGSLEPEQKSLVSVLTLIGIFAHLKATRESGHLLRNVIIIDEAHALLDQGKGATEEERALSNAMTQLMINIITEIRAYGVGIVFSDQSPSRIGGQMLDNVDNIVSFRLSGEEAESLRIHIGAEEHVRSVLPLMGTGDYVLKNRLLKSALPVRMEFDPGEEQRKPVTDEQLAKAQSGYLSSRSGDYRPFGSCESAGCERCTFVVREEANMLATQIFRERCSKLKSPEEIARHIIGIPAVLPSRIPPGGALPLDKICGCVAVHLLRKCALENGIPFSRSAIGKLLSDMHETAKKEA